MSGAAETVRECTAEEGETWQARHRDGYARGRHDARWNCVDGSLLVDIPGEIPGECGARYVTRYLGIAFQIGYTSAVQWASAH